MFTRGLISLGAGAFDTLHLEVLARMVSKGVQRGGLKELLKHKGMAARLTRLCQKFSIRSDRSLVAISAPICWLYSFILV